MTPTGEHMKFPFHFFALVSCLSSFDLTIKTNGKLANKEKQIRRHFREKTEIILLDTWFLNIIFNTLTLSLDLSYNLWTKTIIALFICQ